jgi:hypothetical protein
MIRWRARHTDGRYLMDQLRVNPLPIGFAATSELEALRDERKGPTVDFSAALHLRPKKRQRDLLSPAHDNGGTGEHLHRTARGRCECV